MKEKEIDLLEVIKLLWLRKWFIIVNVFWITSLSIGISLLMPNWYKASCTIMPSSTGGGVFSMLGGGISGTSFGSLFGGNTDQFKLLAILKSRSLKQKIVEEFNLIEKYEVENSEEAIRSFEGNYEVGIGEEMQVFIHIWDKNPDIVSNMANFAIEYLDSINISISSKQGREVKEFLGERVDQLLDSLNAIQNETVNFMKQNNIIHLEEQVKAGVQHSGLLKLQLEAQKVKLGISEMSLSKSNSTIKNIENEIELLSKLYKESLNNTDKEKLFPNFNDVPELGIKLKEIERKIEYYSTILQFLGPQYEKAKLDEMKNVSTIELLDKAVRPFKKDKPKRSIIVIVTFLISSIISSGYIFVKNKSKILS